jgi:hypothetical protein
MIILRSILAVLAGLVFVVAASTLTDLALENSVFPELNTPKVPPPLLALALAYRTLYGAIGGWITAKLAPRHPVRHAVILGVIGTIAGTAGAVVMWSFGQHWYPVALAVLAIPQSWLGAKLAIRAGRAPA